MPGKEVKKIKRKDYGLSAGITFFLFGAVSTAILAYMIAQKMEFKASATECTATISRIEKSGCHGSMGKDCRYTAYVKYIVDGKEYERDFRYYSSGMYTGEVVTVYYNPDNPGEISPGGIAGGLLPFILFALFFVVIGAVMILFALRRYLLRRELLRCGNIVRAEFDSVMPGSSKVNDMSSYIIRCKWTDKRGDAHVLESENLWFDPAPIIEEKRIKKFPVYMDPQNPKRYYISVDEL
jgi:hypothetical protein